MKVGRPRTLADLHCPCCGKRFHPKRAITRFCSRACVDRNKVNAHLERHNSRTRPQYAYRGQLSAELQREVAAARAEMATAPLYRPGASL